MLFSSLLGAAFLWTASAQLLQDFQVYPPVLTPQGITNGSGNPFPSGINPQAQGCVDQQVLMQHVFAYSYGQPFVGKYN